MLWPPQKRMLARTGARCPIRTVGSIPWGAFPRQRQGRAARRRQTWVCLALARVVVGSCTALSPTTSCSEHWLKRTDSGLAFCQEHLVMTLPWPMPTCPPRWWLLSHSHRRSRRHLLLLRFSDRPLFRTLLDWIHLLYRLFRLVMLTEHIVTVLYLTFADLHGELQSELKYPNTVWKAKQSECGSPSFISTPASNLGLSWPWFSVVTVVI